MRRIGVITGARSDYGIYLSILKKIRSEPDLKLHLIVSGMHLSPEFGMTIESIQEDGFEIGDRVEMLLSSDSPEGLAKSIGLGCLGFAQSYAKIKPDILLVLGDRFEMLASVNAALPFKIPIAHIHGGESTEGLIDEAIRHSITKMSHLHFASTEEYANRIKQMGEEPWRVFVSGAPSLDNMTNMRLLDLDEINRQYQLNLKRPFLLATYHPVTLEYEQTRAQMEEFLSAVEASRLTTIFTYPNADTHGRVVLDMITQFANTRENVQVTSNLGTTGYFSLMNQAEAMVGNSSSGIIEAASFKLPVVNIGNRQKGRVCGENVIQVGNDRKEIGKGIRKALSRDFRSQLQDLTNPYGNGQASEIIVRKLGEVELNDRLLFKCFYRLQGGV